MLYLSQIEAEKKRSDELLHVILPPDIVKELKANGSVAPRPFAGAIEPGLSLAGE